MSGEKAYLSVDVLAAVAAEVAAAVAKHGLVNTPLHPSMSTPSRLSILVEEVGEVAHEINEHYLSGRDRNHYYTHLEAELVQVAAVSIMWLEAIRAKKASS